MKAKTHLSLKLVDCDTLISMLVLSVHLSLLKMVSLIDRHFYGAIVV